jgi:multiple antibiotic resistance protein
VTIELPSIEFAARAFLSLLVVVDPAGLVPAFISAAGSRSATVQRSIARRAILIAGGILLAFAIAGDRLFSYLGIQLGAMQIAGGILLFRIAMDMVFAQLRRETAEEEAETRSRQDISVFPLAIPLIAGPGTIASVLILGSETRGAPGAFLVVLIAGAVVLALALASLLLARRLSALLGQTGINVVTRVLGLILAALAIQYVANGLVGLGIVPAGRGAL